MRLELHRSESVIGFHIGQSAAVKRRFAGRDLVEYRALAAMEPPAAAGDQRVPGPLLGALFSYLLGTELPGRGTNYLKQRLAFPAPAFVGEELTATVEIIRLRPEKDLVNLRTTCTAPGGRVVCEGEALVLVKDVMRAE